jgi:hypothetical protein
MLMMAVGGIGQILSLFLSSSTSLSLLDNLT